jgi:cystathionine beta-lyase/cystathionine gamma-synthase
MADLPDPAALGATAPLATPLYQTSVYRLPDLDALDRVIGGDEPGFIYARDAHPNARQLAAQLAALERADWAVICGSGMGAITAAVLTTLRQGGRIVASNRLYGRTTQLFQQELGRFGVHADFVETNDLESVERALATPTGLLFVETLSNPLLRAADLEALVELAHRRGCRLVVDNTFATPELVRPLAVGADLVIESLTKLIGGHSDVTLGLLCGQRDLGTEVAQIISIWGLAANPFDCWLAERGLATLALRARAASANAAALADWLVDQPGVTRVVYPGRADHPDRELAGRLFGRYFGNMLCFELAGGRDAVNRFLRAAPGIPFSPSLGHTSTTCSHPATTSHRHASAEDRARQGISDGLIRLSVGIEDIEEIKKEIGRGLA